MDIQVCQIKFRERVPMMRKIYNHLAMLLALLAIQLPLAAAAEAHHRQSAMMKMRMSHKLLLLRRMVKRLKNIVLAVNSI